MDSLACETIESQFPSWGGSSCQLLTSEIQIKALLNWYLITVSIVMLLNHACNCYGYAVRPILVFAHFAVHTSEMEVVDTLVSYFSGQLSSQIDMTYD